MLCWHNKLGGKCVFIYLLIYLKGLPHVLLIIYLNNSVTLISSHVITWRLIFTLNIKSQESNKIMSWVSTGYVPLWNERKIQWDFHICPPFKNNNICLLQCFFQDLVGYNFDYCILSHKICQRTLFFRISSLILFSFTWKIFLFLPAKPEFYHKL